MAKLPVSNNYHIPSVSSPPPTEPRIEDVGYFEIIKLSQEGVATLKPFSSSSTDPDDVQDSIIGGTTRKFELDLKRDEGDVKVIRAGLMGADQQVFSTIVKIMGKEVMGNIRILAKDPSILRMPDLVMDKIFSFLGRTDLLNLRLVAEPLAKSLPFQKFLVSPTLTLAFPSGFTALYPSPVTLSDKRYYWGERSRVDMELTLKSYPCPLLEGSMVESLPLVLLQEVVDLHVISFQGEYSRFPQSMLLNNCGKVRKFKCLEWNGNFLGNRKLGCDGTTWNFMETFMTKYGGQLEHLKVYIGRCSESENYLDLQDLLINCSGRLQKLWIIISGTKSLRNLESLKGTANITSLRILGLSVAFSKSEILWISRNLHNLRRVLLQVNHTHSNEFVEDEVDGETMVGMVTSLEHLQRFHFAFGLVPFSDEGTFGYAPAHRFCSKFEGIKDHIMMGIRGWEVTNWKETCSRTHTSIFWRPESHIKGLEVLVGTKDEK